MTLDNIELFTQYLRTIAHNERSPAISDWAIQCSVRIRLLLFDMAEACGMINQWKR